MEARSRRRRKQTTTKMNLQNLLTAFSWKHPWLPHRAQRSEERHCRCERARLRREQNGSQRFTVHLAKVLRGSRIKVNSAHPGSVKTDMNPTGSLTVEEGAETAVELATVADDGPSGGFFHRGEKLPW